MWWEILLLILIPIVTVVIPMIMECRSENLEIAKYDRNDTTDTNDTDN